MYFHLLRVVPPLTHEDDGTLGTLYQQGGPRRGVHGLVQVLGALAVSQRPHWAVTRNTTHRHNALRRRCASSAAEESINPPFTFQLKASFSPGENYNRKTDIPLCQSSLLHSTETMKQTLRHKEVTFKGRFPDS